MEIKVFQPKSELLQKHIDCFYMVHRDMQDPPTTYLTFPSINQPVSVYAATRTEVTPDSVLLYHQPQYPLESRIVGKFQKAVFVRYQGPINEITTLFRPLSINAFLPLPLIEFAEEHFPIFNPDAGYLPAMEKVYSITDPEEKLKALERFWLARFNQFRHPFLEAVIAYLENHELEGAEINELCRIYQISRQNLHRHFKKYIGKSPSTFRRILRFRKALRGFGSDLSFNELSKLSAASNYFDQSHMIRDFRAITGHSPKVFFREISQMGNGLVNFMFLPILK